MKVAVMPPHIRQRIKHRKKFIENWERTCLKQTYKGTCKGCKYFHGENTVCIELESMLNRITPLMSNSES